MERRPAAIRKSDLTPAFEAAKAAGYDHVSIVVETEDGKRFLITAAVSGNIPKPDMTVLEKWRAGRAKI
ncbi:CHAP domain-containing protein [Pseudaestuariivita rosea]|uniref:CHAP domain-containing protein n=1 Tax=Pseudaestuariivita rosea TaxID=2763263 RepID=UPI001ABAE643|nr:CHAP domain-containing protein [Pseudaestuariivita rosea]